MDDHKFVISPNQIDAFQNLFILGLVFIRNAPMRKSELISDIIAAMLITNI